MNFSSYQKECPECGETYNGHRLNQIYCTQSCKARYNNRKAREEEERLRKINKITSAKNRILWKNRQILEKYVDQQVNVSALESAGFRLGFITDFYQDSDEDNILQIYDYGYYFIDEKTVKIFKV